MPYKSYQNWPAKRIFIGPINNEIRQEDIKSIEFIQQNNFIFLCQHKNVDNSAKTLFDLIVLFILYIKLDNAHKKH